MAESVKPCILAVRFAVFPAYTRPTKVLSDVAPWLLERVAEKQYFELQLRSVQVTK